MALDRTNLKQTPIPVVPRNMQIVNADGTVTRSGQLLLQQLQASEALQGTHAGRPAPGDAPDGALYVESDRLVLYSNIDGAWHYIAGTDWGTLNPDRRPTDLGVNDAGFDFRTVDDPAREFIWSQVNWIEVTPVRYGTHAARLAVALSGVIDQMLWVETDRGGVIYQTQGHNWVYVSGLMNSLLANKPSDLGANDTGFKFCATDYNHVLMWNGSGWQWGPGETGGGYFDYFAVAPSGNGWHICDGSTVTYLKPDSTTASITLPNAVATPCYAKGGNSFSATVNPANGATGSHALTVAEMPSHQHGLSQLQYNTNYTQTGAGIALTGTGAGPLTQQTDLTGGGGGHSHPISGDMVPNFGAYLYFRQ